MGSCREKPLVEFPWDGLANRWRFTRRDRRGNGPADPSSQSAPSLNNVYDYKDDWHGFLEPAYEGCAHG
ncbi:MAG: hypothetical protein HY232_07845 [Acidobacteria bacterium]|nr:hypothetical protein [Acidobacteriota bacterium]